jgi:hypothetical protein
LEYRESAVIEKIGVTPAFSVNRVEIVLLKRHAFSGVGSIGDSDNPTLFNFKSSFYRQMWLTINWLRMVSSRFDDLDEGMDAGIRVCELAPRSSKL